MKEKSRPDIFLVQILTAPIKPAVYKTLNVSEKPPHDIPGTDIYINNLTFSGIERLITLVPNFYKFFNPLTAA